MSHQKIYTFCSGIMLSTMMKHHLALFKMVEQIDIIKEVVLSAVSKLNDKATNKEQREQTIFSK